VLLYDSWSHLPLIRMPALLTCEATEAAAYKHSEQVVGKQPQDGVVSHVCWSFQRAADNWQLHHTVRSAGTACSTVPTVLTQVVCRVQQLEAVHACRLAGWLSSAPRGHSMWCYHLQMRVLLQLLSTKCCN
jgi:hypothetical protein